MSATVPDPDHVTSLLELRASHLGPITLQLDSKGTGAATAFTASAVAEG